MAQTNKQTNIVIVCSRMLPIFGAPTQKYKQKHQSKNVPQTNRPIQQMLERRCCQFSGPHDKSTNKRENLEKNTQQKNNHTQIALVCTQMLPIFWAPTQKYKQMQQPKKHNKQTNKQQTLFLSACRCCQKTKLQTSATTPRKRRRKRMNKQTDNCCVCLHADIANFMGPKTKV